MGLIYVYNLLILDLFWLLPPRSTIGRNNESTVIMPNSARIRNSFVDDKYGEEHNC